ncbi:hypothetical protein PRIPAC_84389 [Pristionchus pacificus]|uniref:Uncharacterized protein n=1 Tax=Pristionchus pacificus TaxID=54126 RepID=A0A2A6BMC4_PRIPA|nr:hypothetical protein PRIPAC_84389 [Pristionchus pacificus]|eukprot:PDM67049.1 hypothetical protein PRIPAC_48466 [Pristionchus pacificus]
MLIFLFIFSILSFALFLCTSTKEKELSTKKLTSKKIVGHGRENDEMKIGKLRQHEDECDLSRSMVREKGKVIEDDIPSLSLSFTPTMDEKKN